MLGKPFGIVAIATIAVLGSLHQRAIAHADPPFNAPSVTNVGNLGLIFIGDIGSDGFNDAADVVITGYIDWGRGHQRTPILFYREENADGRTINHPLVWTGPEGLASHTECTPDATPTAVTMAFETNKGTDPIATIVAAAGGAVVGAFTTGSAAGAGFGGATGATAETAITGLIEYFAGETPLRRGIEWGGGFVTFDRFIGGAGGSCASTADCLRDASSVIPYEPLRSLNEQYLAVGVDENHPFSRNAAYASGRYDLLMTALAQADALAANPGEASDVANAQRAVRVAAAGIAAIVAQAALDEARDAALDPLLFASFAQLLGRAAEAATLGDYVLAVGLYEGVTTGLLPLLHPGYNVVSEPSSVALAVAAGLVMAGVRARRRPRR